MGMGMGMVVIKSIMYEDSNDPLCLIYFGDQMLWFICEHLHHQIHYQRHPQTPFYDEAEYGLGHWFVFLSPDEERLSKQKCPRPNPFLSMPIPVPSPPSFPSNIHHLHPHPYLFDRIFVPSIHVPSENLNIRQHSFHPTPPAKTALRMQPEGPSSLGNTDASNEAISVRDSTKTNVECPRCGRVFGDDSRLNVHSRACESVFMRRAVPNDSAIKRLRDTRFVEVQRVRLNTHIHTPEMPTPLSFPHICAVYCPGAPISMSSLSMCISRRKCS